MIVRAMAALLAGAFLMGASPASNDPYVYMEEAEGAKALDFARAENARLQRFIRERGHEHEFEFWARGIAQ